MFRNSINLISLFGLLIIGLGISLFLITADNLWTYPCFRGKEISLDWTMFLIMCFSTIIIAFGVGVYRLQNWARYAVLTFVLFLAILGVYTVGWLFVEKTTFSIFPFSLEEIGAIVFCTSFLLSIFLFFTNEKVVQQFK